MLSLFKQFLLECLNWFSIRCYFCSARKWPFSPCHNWDRTNMESEKEMYNEPHDGFGGWESK